MTAKKKVQPVSGLSRASGAAAGATAHPVRKRRAVASAVKPRSQEAYTPQDQAAISTMLDEIQKKNDELTERVGRLLTRLS